MVWYDTKTLVDCIPQFVELQTKNGLFEQIRVDQGGYGVFWNDDLDIDSDTIWEDGTLIETQKETNINKLLAYHLLLAREEAHMTQKQLAEKTGIYQADISKIERGLGNPSVSTINRLADGLGMKLEIKFLHKSI